MMDDRRLTTQPRETKAAGPGGVGDGEEHGEAQVALDVHDAFDAAVQDEVYEERKAEAHSNAAGKDQADDLEKLFGIESWRRRALHDAHIDDLAGDLGFAFA